MLVWLTVLVCLAFSFNQHIFTPRPPDLMSPLCPELFPAIEFRARIWSSRLTRAAFFLRANSNVILLLVAESGKSEMIDGVR